MIGDWKRIPLLLRIVQVIFTFVVGGIFGWYTGSYLVGGGLAAIARKLAFGDWDQGFAWTSKDLLFWATSFAEGAAGAAVAHYFRVREIVNRELRIPEYTDRLKSEWTVFPDLKAMEHPSA